MERRTLTMEEAAKALGISRTSAYALARSGELPVLRLGHRFVVPCAEFDAFLAGEPLPSAS